MGGDEKKSRLCRVNVSDKVYKEFRKKCIDLDQSIGDTLGQLVKDYVSDYSG